MRFNCTSLWTLYFSDKDIERRFYCVHLRRALKKKKENFVSPPLHAHTENTVNFHNPLPSTFPPSLRPPSTANGLCLPSRLFPDIRFYFLLSLLSFPLYLSIYLSVCPSLATSHAHSHDQSATRVRITPIHFVHSLAHSPALAHTHWLGFFFFIPYTVIVYVCNNMKTLLQSRAFIAAPSFLFSLVKRARRSTNEKEKKNATHFKYRIQAKRDNFLFLS